MKYLMGIDCGGTVLKTSIFDLEGKERSTFGITMPVTSLGAGRYERDAYLIENSAYRSISGAISKAGIDPAEIAGIGLTGQANGLYMFKKDGTPVHSGVMSSDTRANDLVRKLYEDGTYERLLPILRQSIYAAQTPVLMAWFAKNEPEVIEQAEVCVTVKEYIRFLLTGQWAMEITEASVLSLLDQDKCCISDDILDSFGILKYKNRFPKRMLRSEEVGGTVTVHVAELTGLRPGTPVVGGLFDCTANTISQGVIKEDQLCIVAGTWGMNNMITKQLIYSDHLFGSYLYCLPGTHQLMEGSATSCSNLEWFINTFLKQQGMEFCGYGELNRMIVEEAKEESALFFLPFIYGTNVDLDAKAAFIGLTGNDEIPEMLRAIYEGVVFAHMYHLERLLKFVDPPATIRASGGGSKSDVWMQMFSDAIGKEIEISEADEVGTLGCAMMAGVGTGCYHDVYDAVERCVHIRKTYYPNPTKYQYYQKKYEIYLRILRVLDPLWKDIVSVVEIEQRI